MASLRRISKSPFWIACFTLPNGKRTSRSTKTANRRDAQRIGNKWAAAAAQARQEQRVLAAINVGTPAPPRKGSTFRDFCQAWLERKQVENSSGTWLRYRASVRRVLDQLGDKSDEDVSLVSERDICAVRDAIAASLSPESANYALRVLRIVLNQAKREGLAAVNRGSNVGLIRLPKVRRRRPFTVEEIRRLLANADDEWRGMILLGLCYGLRIGDAALLKWGNVDLNGKQLTLVTQKTGHRLELPITMPVEEYFERIKSPTRPSDYLFPTLSDLASSGPRSGILSKRFLALMKRAGLIARDRQNKPEGLTHGNRVSPLSFHSLRHTATSTMMRAGANQASVMAVLGHSSLIMSAAYTHVDKQSKLQVLQVFNELCLAMHHP